jgi:hypothetical protein
MYREVTANRLAIAVAAILKSDVSLEELPNSKGEKFELAGLPKANMFTALRNSAERSILFVRSQANLFDTEVLRS